MSEDTGNTNSNVNDELQCEDESNTMTLGDILKAEEMLEENAEAVLGPGDDKHCTTIEARTFLLQFYHYIIWECVIIQ